MSLIPKLIDWESDTLPSISNDKSRVCIFGSPRPLHHQSFGFLIYKKIADVESTDMFFELFAAISTGTVNLFPSKKPFSLPLTVFVLLFVSVVSIVSHASLRVDVFTLDFTAELFIDTASVIDS